MLSVTPPLSIAIKNEFVKSIPYAAYLPNHTSTGGNISKRNTMSLGKIETEIKGRLVQVNKKVADLVRETKIGRPSMSGWLNGTYNLPADRLSMVMAVIEGWEAGQA